MNSHWYPNEKKSLTTTSNITASNVIQFFYLLIKVININILLKVFPK